MSVGDKILNINKIKIYVCSFSKHYVLKKAISSTE